MEKIKKSENTTKEKEQSTKKSKARKLIVLIFIAIAIISIYTVYRGNYLETLELGNKFLSVFWRNTSYQTIVFSINFILLFIAIYITNKRIKKGLIPFFADEKKEIPKMLNKSIALIISIVFSFFISNIMLEKFMLCINMTAFELTDPILGYDIGYFIFVQPFVQLIFKYLLGIIISLTIYAALYYIIAFNIYFDGISRETLKKSILIKQACNNILMIAIILAGSIFVETFNVGLQKFINLQDVNSYALWGAGISEVTIKLWGYRILSIVVIVSIMLAIIYLKKGNTKKVISSLAVVPAYLILMLVTLVGFELVFVNPNELDKQQQYIQANIDFTKQAYGIDIEEIALGENETVTRDKLNQNTTVIDNIVLANKEMVLKDLNTLQTNKGYYTYRTTKILKNNKDLVYISPREITDSAGTYNNKTYEYTHGYGVIVTSATDIDEKGNLVHLQKSFAENQESVIRISEPRIYFGLETNDTVVTNSNGKKEFDYPIMNSAKAENAENVYQGKAGLKLNFVDRLILAIKQGDLKLAFSGNITSESRILINRNIVERSKTLMPYILYDENAYLVVSKDGRLVWVLDGYTTSDAYPYSQRITLDENRLLNKTEINYIRNSVKVLIDAYDGTIQYYITDRSDPIIMAYQKIYKDLFVEKDITIPEDISSQFIYPEFLYNIQAQIMEKYHHVQPDVLYRGDDIWAVATHNTSKVTTKTGTEIEPYYTMIKTENYSETTLGLVLPYTPYQKQNLISYLVGSYENGEKKLTLYKYPSNSNIVGPMQIDTQLEQDDRISAEIEDLNITGTKLIRNMIVIPIDNSLLYVEPIYQQYINEENSTPVLKKVVVASGNKIAIGDNLEQSLSNLVSQYAVDFEVEDTESVEGLIDAIVKSNNNLKESTAKNNWEMYGKDMAKLQELIAKLEKLIEEQEKDNKEGNSDNNKNEIINNTVNVINNVSE